MKDPTFVDRAWFYFRKPEYLFQPNRILSTIFSSKKTSADSDCSVALPWGGNIEVRRGETIGEAIYKHGVYELSVSEVLYRLLKEGGDFVDVGANIGYMTHLMASVSSGCGWAFEPHPRIFPRACRNLGQFGERLKIRQCAAGKGPGILPLVEPDSFECNEGTARMGIEGEAGSMDVEVVRLDDIIPENVEIRVMKIDVEGAELDVLQGASKGLEMGKYRFIVYEDFGDYPTPSSKFLSSFGYSITRLTKGLLGPISYDPDRIDSRSIDLPWEPTNYIATRCPDELANRLGVRGYQVLKHGASVRRQSLE